MGTDSLRVQLEVPLTGLSCRTLIQYLQTVIDCLTQLDRVLSHSDSVSVVWNVKYISMSSPVVIELQPVSKGKRKGRKPDPDEASPVSRAFVRGLRQIEESSKRPDAFDDDVLDYAARLARFRHREHVVGKFSIDQEEVAPTEHGIANVEAILGRSGRYYYMETQLEGVLERVSVHGALTFSIFDLLNGRPTTCDFVDEQLPDVIEFLRHRKRVRVTGRVKFNAKHAPISVEVERFEALPDAKELPQIADLHAAKIDITDGRDSVDYVGEMRDE